MARVLFHLLIGCFALATTLSAQTQITTGVIQGTVMDSTGAVLPGVDVTVVQSRDELLAEPTTDQDGRFAFLQLAAGPIYRDIPSARVQHCRSGQHRPDRRAGRQSHSAPCGRQRIGNCDRDEHAGRRDDSCGRRDNAESGDDRDHADPRPQVRGPAHADAGRQRRAGRRRR